MADLQRAIAHRDASILSSLGIDTPLSGNGLSKPQLAWSRSAGEAGGSPVFVQSPLVPFATTAPEADGAGSGTQSKSYPSSTNTPMGSPPMLRDSLASRHTAAPSADDDAALGLPLSRSELGIVEDELDESVETAGSVESEPDPPVEPAVVIPIKTRSPSHASPTASAPAIASPDVPMKTWSTVASEVPPVAEVDDTDEQHNRSSLDALASFDVDDFLSPTGSGVGGRSNAGDVDTGTSFASTVEGDAESYEHSAAIELDPHVYGDCASQNSGSQGAEDVNDSADSYCDESEGVDVHSALGKRLSTVDEGLSELGSRSPLDGEIDVRMGDSLVSPEPDDDDVPGVYMRHEAGEAGIDNVELDVPMTVSAGTSVVGDIATAENSPVASEQDSNTLHVSDVDSNGTEESAFDVDAFLQAAATPVDTESSAKVASFGGDSNDPFSDSLGELSNTVIHTLTASNATGSSLPSSGGSSPVSPPSRLKQVTVPASPPPAAHLSPPRYLARVRTGSKGSDGASPRMRASYADGIAMTSPCDSGGGGGDDIADAASEFLLPSTRSAQTTGTIDVSAQSPHSSPMFAASPKSLSVCARHSIDWRCALSAS